MPSNNTEVEGRIGSSHGDRLEGHGFIELDEADDVLVTVTSYEESGEPYEVNVRLIGDGWSTGVSLSPSQARGLAQRLRDAAEAWERR